MKTIQFTNNLMSSDNMTVVKRESVYVVCHHIVSFAHRPLYGARDTGSKGKIFCLAVTTVNRESPEIFHVTREVKNNFVKEFEEWEQEQTQLRIVKGLDDIIVQQANDAAAAAAEHYLSKFAQTMENSILTSQTTLDTLMKSSHDKFEHLTEGLLKMSEPGLKHLSLLGGACRDLSITINTLDKIINRD